MTVFQALVLGLIQGLTEFLPISSSGHLVFVPTLFGWADQGLAFDVFVHLGSLIAVVIYFRTMLSRLLISLFKKKSVDRRLAWMLVLSIVPAGIVGFFFGDWIESSLRSATVIATSLIVWGVVLFIADKYSQRCFFANKTTQIKDMTWGRTVFVACAQAIALIPGTSRSGITMSAGLFATLTKEDAARFSFLMSVPVILVAGAVKVSELASQGGAVINWSAYSVGFLAAAVSGYLAIAGLMKLIQKWRFTPFVVYRIVVGVLILLFLT